MRLFYFKYVKEECLIITLVDGSKIINVDMETHISQINYICNRKKQVRITHYLNTFSAHGIVRKKRAVLSDTFFCYT